MWPEGQTISFGRPVLRMKCSGHSETPVEALEDEAPAVEPPAIDPAALEEARLEGYQMGREEAQREFAGVREFMKKCAESFQTGIRSTGERLDVAAVKLALEIAAKLLDRELKNPAAAREYFLNALKLAPHDEKIVLRLHPDTRKTLAALEGATGGLNLPSHINLVEDHSVGVGGCIIQTPVENWDAQVSSRLALIARELSGGQEQT